MQIFYTANQGEPFYPRAALSGAAGKTVELAYDERGFRVVLANGMDPVAPEPEEGEEPVEPAPAWESYSSDPQPTPDWVAAWRPVEPEQAPPAPVTDVDRARQYAEAYAAAEQIIFLLMGRVAPALVVGGFFTPETVNAEGTRFMAFHRDLIIDFKNSGRHPDAGTALYNAIAATPSTTAFPWLLANGGAILAIFGNGLPRNA